MSNFHTMNSELYTQSKDTTSPTKNTGKSIIPYLEKYYKPYDMLYSFNLGPIKFVEILDKHPLKQHMLQSKSYTDEHRSRYFANHTDICIKTETSNGDFVYFNLDGSINLNGYCQLYPMEVYNKIKNGLAVNLSDVWSHKNFNEVVVENPLNKFSVTKNIKRI